MREKPIGVVLTILAVLAVGAAPAAFVVLDRVTATRPERAAVSNKPQQSEQSGRKRAQRSYRGSYTNQLPSDQATR